MQELIVEMTDNIYENTKKSVDNLMEVSNYDNWINQLVPEAKEELGITEQTLIDSHQIFEDARKEYFETLTGLVELYKFYYPTLKRIELLYEDNSRKLKKEIKLWIE